MAEQVIKRHPIRGFIWGILFGLGLALIAIGQGYAALGTLPPFILVIVGIVVGTVWGLVAPAKQPKGEPPRQPVPVEKVEPSRFDDFTDPTPTGTPARRRADRGRRRTTAPPPNHRPPPSALASHRSTGRRRRRRVRADAPRRTRTEAARPALTLPVDAQPPTSPDRHDPGSLAICGR